MLPDPPVISHAIQLAIAPVFLLTGIFCATRMDAAFAGRAEAGARQLEHDWHTLDEQARSAARDEIADLEQRRHLASWSINFCASAALLVCLVIVTLFVEEFFSANLKWLAGGLFVCAMLALIGGLFSFLREVYLATSVVRFDIAKFDDQHDG
jgi:hypothetical protein